MKLKRIISFALSLCMLLTIAQFPVMAATTGTTADGLEYSIENNAVTITGYTGTAIDVIIPSTIESYPVTSIGEMAFYGCSNLESVTIPTSVTSIGTYAFEACSSLANITIPNSITKIGSMAFKYCTSLTSITIPDSVTSIGSAAFANCRYLTSITISDSVTSIEMSTFNDCCRLTSINIPDGVTKIGNGAFYNCLSLTNITIPDTVTSIDNRAFNQCKLLADVYYNGTKAQKESISIGSSNSYLTDATWHYVLCDSGHTYDNDCDTECNVCEEIREVSNHVYDNACDADCNICGATRTTTHKYDNACDASCNECGTTRTVGGHVYDNETDTTCNECGDTREVATPDINAPTFVAESKTVKIGDTFTVDISIKNNSGIVGLRTYIGYDANVLELVSAAAGDDFADTSFGPTTKNPISILWDDSLASSNNTSNGVVATLTFKVKEGVTACNTEITLTYNADDVYDFNWDNVEFGVENGTITVIEYISGDVNGDGNINNKDLGVLRRWLNDWDVEIDELAADVNRDGNVNNKDLGILRRYLNDWDVELK